MSSIGSCIRASALLNLVLDILPKPTANERGPPALVQSLQAVYIDDSAVKATPPFQLQI